MIGAMGVLYLSFAETFLTAPWGRLLNRITKPSGFYMPKASEF